MTEGVFTRSTTRSVLPVGSLDGACRALLHRSLSGLADARLTIFDGDGAESFGEAGRSGLRASITVRDPVFYRRIAARGVVGAAEAYMDGAWDADDLTAVVRIIARNRELAGRLDGRLAAAARPLLRAFAARRRNTKAGSRDNIAAHYDLGNELFASFLDPTMTYSTAIWDGAPDASLEEAAVAKYERVCRKIDLRPTDHVLEIGTGWGGFAIHAASRWGCRVTTTTISREQYGLARERVAAAGLNDRVEVVMQDYRDLDGVYDKLVSIEMIEAVGHEFLDEYFRRCCERLRPDGLFLVEAITIPDRDFEASKHSVEFIKRYIFPGGSLPSIASMCDSAKRATDFRVIHLEELSDQYARTLAEWRRAFRANRDQLRGRGIPERFLRMWEFYFCYCEGGFSERAIGTVQMLFERSQGRRPAVLGRLDAPAPATCASRGERLPAHGPARRETGEAA